MNHIKEDAQRNRQSEQRRNKEISQLKKDQRMKDKQIKDLEISKHQKETILRRKQEEVELLRKKTRPMSAKVAGRTGRYTKPSTGERHEMYSGTVGI